MKYLLLFFFLVSTVVESQNQRDTSYTISSTYKKEKIRFPFIHIATEPKSSQLCIKKDIVYKQLENTVLKLDAFFENKESLNPAVVLLHGGGWKSGDKTQMHALAAAIALRGYACFCVAYRLSEEAQYPAAIQDVKSAIQFVKVHARKFKLNPNKIAVLGCSSGGQMAALIGSTNKYSAFEDPNAKENASVQAIVNMDGILAFHHPESEEGKVASLWLGGSYEEKPLVWNQASALAHVDQNTAPLLFINSANPRFHAGQQDMIAVLEHYGIYNEVRMLPNSPHSFWFFHPWFGEIVDYTTHFLDKILKNKQ